MVKVNVVMIARDEERCIARAITSVIGLVDEVVVLDTGSKDDTVAVARRAGAEVTAGTWPASFSAARNAALDLSDADANLVIDADEWLIEGAEWLGRLRSLDEWSDVGVVTVRSASSADGVTVETDTAIERLIPSDIRYTGAVHEYPVHTRPVATTPLVFAHDGYEAGQMERKAGRNDALLRAELRDCPGSAYLHYQLGKELQARERYSESAASYAEALRLGTLGDAWRHSLVVRSLSVFGKIGDFESALALADLEGVNWHQSPDFYFALGNVLLDFALAQPDRAGELIPLIESSWQRCLAIGERPELEGAVRGRGSWLAAHNLAGFYESLGRESKAREYRLLAQR